MIDHVSLGVRSLEAAERFYEALLAPLGFTKLVTRQKTIGFGKRYPEFWINLRADMARVEPTSGTHVCLRARSISEVDNFHKAAVAGGGGDDGAPGPRAHDRPGWIYYAAFVTDPDGNRVEAVTFVEDKTNDRAPGSRRASLRQDGGTPI